MKEALTERLSYAHGFPKKGFSQALYALASESVADNYNHFLQELKQETKGHLFTEIPAGGFEAQYIQLLTDSISYFIGKKCHLPDEEIQLSDGMATVSHFNTLPLVAHLGTAVTALSKGILLIVHFRHKGEQLFPFPGHLLYIHVGVQFRPFHQFPLWKFQTQGAGL